MTPIVDFRSCVGRALIFAGVILALSSIFVGSKHVWAEHVLDATDFQVRTTSGATFFAAPKKLFVHQRATTHDLITHLNNIGFTPGDSASSPGTYTVLSKSELTVTPRFPEFQRVRVKVSSGRISGLATAPNESDTFSPTSETSIEPEILGSFVEKLNGDDRARMFVKRQVVSYATVVDSAAYWALLASEDRIFPLHNGTRFDRLLLGLLPGNHGGGSSITTQTVKNSVSLQWRHSIGRKVDEVFLASALEDRMSKPQILTLYINNVFLGGGPSAPNVYGFSAAAAQYYGKSDLKSLTLSEASAMVAMLPRPNYFVQQARNGNYEPLREARNRVLDRMLVAWPAKYSRAAIEEAKSEPLVFVEQSFRKTETDSLSAAFVDIASHHESLVELNGLPPEQYSGLHLFTSLDLALTKSAQHILDTDLPKIQSRYPPMGGGSCSTSEDRLLGAIVALDPRTGAIVVASGSGGGRDGVDYAKLALNATAPPASSIKPLWIALALDNRSVNSDPSLTAATVVPTERGAQRVRSALAWSSDQLGRDLVSRIGPNRAVSFFESLTGKHPEASAAMLALGFGRATEISPLPWARVYSAFVLGKQPQLAPISTVYLDGRQLDQLRPQSSSVLDPGIAFITTQMLRSVVGFGPDGRNGTAKAAASSAGLRTSELAIAGKTGSGPHAVWMTSVSPNLTVVVLVTYRCHSEIRDARRLMASETAAPIWAKFIAAVVNDRPDLLSGAFEKPTNVQEAKIDSRFGCQTDSPRGVREYFLEGTTPAACESSHGKANGRSQ